MTKQQKVLDYYLLCNKLKNVIRTGWKNWNIKRNRVESIAEHIYGVQQLAIIMKSEYQYDIDLEKVIMMLAIHELGETIIGDLTIFDISAKEKQKIEREAVHSILSTVIDGDKLEKLFLEFDEHETKEALFAYQCDKLECDIQSKIYDEEKSIDLNDQDGNIIKENKNVHKLIEEGNSFSDMWIKFGQQRYPYDKNFLEISNYLLNNNILKEKR